MNRKQKVIIVGARIDGQAGVVVNAIQLRDEYEIIGFIDNTPDLQETKINGVPVIGSTDDLETINFPVNNIHIAIGDNLARFRLQKSLKSLGCNPITIIHPTATISDINVKIGEGSFIGPNTIVNNGSVIGDASIINSGAIVEHDNLFGEAVHVAPGVKTGGRVKIGNYSFIGVGSCILPDIEIGSGVLVGAGSTVTKNVNNKVTMIGYSAKPYNKSVYESILPDIGTNNEIYVAQPTLPKFEALDKRFRNIYDRKMLSNFSENSNELEGIITELLSVKNALTIPSLTTGLMLIFKALGIKGEVILPSFTFSATGHALIWNNLKPVFADINPDTFNLDVEDVERKITDNTSAILGVHIFGNPCEIDSLQRLASKYELKLVYDSAHALGSKYKGDCIGQFGDCEGFSLSGTKMITSAEGGIITSNDSELMEKLSMGRNYGSSADYNCQYIGLNGKMSEFHAAIAIESLSLMSQSIENRLMIVNLYKERLSIVPGITFQEVDPKNLSTYKDFGVLIDPKKYGMNRDLLQTELASEKIYTKKYFYPSLHQMDVYKQLFPEVDNKELKNTEYVANNIISLPIYSHMGLDTVEKICYSIDRIQRFKT